MQHACPGRPAHVRPDTSATKRQIACSPTRKRDEAVSGDLLCRKGHILGRTVRFGLAKPGFRNRLGTVLDENLSQTGVRATIGRGSHNRYVEKQNGKKLRCSKAFNVATKVGLEIWDRLVVRQNGLCYYEIPRRDPTKPVLIAHAQSPGKVCDREFSEMRVLR